VDPDAIWDCEWGQSSVLDGDGEHRRGKGSFEGELGASIVTNGDSVE